MDPMDDELRSEYDAADLRGGERGKNVKKIAAGTNLVRIEPELAAAFAGEEAIDDALRFVLHLPEAVERLKEHGNSAN